jgi:glutaredoxin
MKKSLKIGLLVTGLIIVSLGLAFIKSRPAKQILFYSNYCPHCKNVEKYINDNNIKQKFTFDELEVADDAANANILTAKAIKCGIDPNNIGVPMFFDGKQCLVGDQDIINYLSSK